MNSTRDPDPIETAEWRDAFSALLQAHGPQPARQMLDELAQLARQQRIDWTPELATPYINTIALDAQPAFPGDLAVQERLASLMRWNVRLRWSCARTIRTENLASTSPATRARPICSRPGSTTFSMRGPRRTAATWCSSSGTARRASTHAPTLRGN